MLKVRSELVSQGNGILQMIGIDTLTFQRQLDVEMWDELMENLINISDLKEVSSLYIWESEAYQEVAKIV